MQRLPARLAAALALLAGALLFTGPATATAATSAGAAAATTASSMTAVSTGDPARAAGGYLARQLAAAPGGLLQSGGFAQQGETIDALLSLASTKVAASQQAQTLGVLHGQESSYISYAGTYYPGSLGKLTLAIQAEGGNADTFGQVPLVSKLLSMECTAQGTPTGCTSTDVGLYKSVDPSAPAGTDGNAYNSTVSQSLAMIALSRTATPPSAAAVRWLVGQQCADGGFQTAIRTVSAAACSSEDGDSTAFATQALVAAGSTPAATKAATFLAGKQARDGSLTGASGKGSANSTALAAQAFTAVDGSYAADAARAQGYLRTVQAGCSAPAVKRGSVSAPADGDAAFATSQGAQGLVGTPLAKISREGSTSAVPTLDCASRPSSQPSAIPTAASATSTAPATPPSAVPTVPQGAAGISAGPAAATLPETGGATVPRTVLAGLALLLTGGALMLVARQRGRRRA